MFFCICHLVQNIERKYYWQKLLSYCSFCHMLTLALFLDSGPQSFLITHPIIKIFLAKSPKTCLFIYKSCMHTSLLMHYAHCKPSYSTKADLVNYICIFILQIVFWWLRNFLPASCPVSLEHHCFFLQCGLPEDWTYSITSAIF